MRAVNHPSRFGPVPPISDAAAQIDPPRNPRSHRRRIFLVGAAVVLLLGFIFAWRSIGPSELAPSEAELGGFAERFVSTLLTRAGEDTAEVLIPFLGYAPDLTGVEPGERPVLQTGVLSINAVGPKRWTVMVAATRLGRTESGYVPSGALLYEVSLEQTPAGLRAVAWPSPIKAPAGEVRPESR